MTKFILFCLTINLSDNLTEKPYREKLKYTIIENESKSDLFLELIQLPPVRQSVLFSANETLKCCSRLTAVIQCYYLNRSNQFIFTIDFVGVSSST